MTVKVKKYRIWELDFLRGLAILMVIMDHAMYDFTYAFADWANSGVGLLEFLNEIGSMYMRSQVRIDWRPAFLCLFFVTSGLCTAFSRNNFLRGLRLAFVAMLISLVTYYANEFIPSNIFILFGVLHCMAVIILCYSVFSMLVELCVKLTYKVLKRPFNDRVYKYILSALCLVLSIVFYIINHKYNVGLVDATAYYSAVDTDSKILGLFFYTRNWWTSDYFPLFPFISFFFFGASFTQLLYARKRSLLPQLDGIWHTPFSVPGRHSLSFYIFGQVVLMCICSLLNSIFLGSAF